MYVYVCVSPLCVSPHVSPVLLCLLVKGFSVALALDVQLAVVEPKEPEDRDFPSWSELTFLVLLVGVLLPSDGGTETHASDSPFNNYIITR